MIKIHEDLHNLIIMYFEFLVFLWEGWYASDASQSCDDRCEELDLVCEDLVDSLCHGCLTIFPEAECEEQFTTGMVPNIYDPSENLRRFDNGGSSCSALFDNNDNLICYCKYRPPTVSPSFAPSHLPTAFPTSEPSLGPTHIPTLEPSINPSLEPSLIPTSDPVSSSITKHLLYKYYKTAYSFSKKTCMESRDTLCNWSKFIKK